MQRHLFGDLVSLSVSNEEVVGAYWSYAFPESELNIHIVCMCM